MPQPAPASDRLLLAVSLGSNVPPEARVPFDLAPPWDPRARALEGALVLLRQRGWILRAASPIFETDPVGVDDSHPLYLNACAAFEIPGSLMEALEDAEAVERDAGRTRKGDGSPRPLDIDLVAAWRVEADSHDLVPLQPVAGEHLSVPHPRASTRAFVLVGLAAILPDAPVVLSAGGRPVTIWRLLRQLARSGPDRVRPGPRSASFPSSVHVGLDGGAA